MGWIPLWGEGVGWIDFAPALGPGVWIAPDGRLVGAAWAQSAGWIVFFLARPQGQLRPSLVSAPAQGLAGEEVVVRFRYELLREWRQ